MAIAIRSRVAGVLSILRALCGIVVFLVMAVSILWPGLAHAIAAGVVSVGVLTGIATTWFLAHTGDTHDEDRIASAMLADGVFVGLAALSYMYSGQEWALLWLQMLVVAGIGVTLMIVGFKYEWLWLQRVGKAGVTVGYLDGLAVLPKYAQMAVSSHQWDVYALAAVPVIAFMVVSLRRFYWIFKE